MTVPDNFHKAHEKLRVCIEMHNIYKAFGEVQALDGVTFSLALVRYMRC